VTVPVITSRGPLHPPAALGSVPGMELLVGAGPVEGLAGRIEVQVVLGPGERTHGVLTLAPLLAELTRLVARVQSRQAADSEVVRLGSILFEALFWDRVGAVYREARGRARAAGQPLRLVLTSAAREVAGLPWEFLYDPSLGHFLALTPEVRLVRSLPSLRPPNLPPAGLPLRVLIGEAGPATYRGRPLFGLDVATERALIDTALAPLADGGYLAVQSVALNSPAELLAAVRRVEPHIFHYIGHSAVVGGVPRLFCGPPGGEAIPMDGAQLATALSLAPALQLVLLNSCWSGQAGVQGSLFGLAPALAEAGVPAVIGWQTGISDRSAPWLAGSLYEELARGATVDEALTVGRLALYANPQAERLAWGLAVGYLRAETTRIVAPPARVWRLLVIDDEPVRADLLQARLARRGLEIAWAAGGAAGLTEARRRRPDVIVLDLKMPGMDGFAVLRELQALPATADIPVVVLTTLGFDYDAALRAYTGGAKYVIPYNGRLDQLEQVLHRNLGVPLG
jgi:CheY-like chemotaxis protein